MGRIKDGKDFWAGIMFMGMGIAFVLFSRNYPMGTAVRMGPAYFPTWLGAMMAALGAVCFIRSFFGKVTSPLKIIELRSKLLVTSFILMAILFFGDEMFFKGNPLIIKQVVSAFAIATFLSAWGAPSLFIILMSIAAFGYLLRPMGLLVATMVLVIGSAYGGHEFKWKESTILGVCMSLFVILVFIKGLGLSMNVWPEWI
ncbi:MAG: tripartite tricarboxylate transporter TctB family protein [Betaproteobacteria bacterium]|nr:tripartite tricarboxylate transporter TctB family protein [Betaproteobacteria bacterium]